MQIGGSYAVSLAAAEALRAGRAAAQTLVNAGRPEEIVFGPSTTVLLQNARRARCAASSRPATRSSSARPTTKCNIGPWERSASSASRSGTGRSNHETIALRLDDLAPLMTDRTRLVCVHHVSNILGQINPVGEIARFVHERGARICVDGVAYAPHRAIDVRRGTSITTSSASTRPTVRTQRVMYGKYELLLELDGLYHYFYGKEKVPGKLEPGNPNYELAYAPMGIVEYLAALGDAPGRHGGTSRARVEAAFARSRGRRTC